MSNDIALRTDVELRMSRKDRKPIDRMIMVGLSICASWRCGSRVRPPSRAPTSQTVDCRPVVKTSAPLTQIAEQSDRPSIRQERRDWPRGPAVLGVRGRRPQPWPSPRDQNAPAVRRWGDQRYRGRHCWDRWSSCFERFADIDLILVCDVLVAPSIQRGMVVTTGLSGCGCCCSRQSGDGGPEDGVVDG